MVTCMCRGGGGCHAPEDPMKARTVGVRAGTPVVVALEVLAEGSHVHVKNGGFNLSTAFFLGQKRLFYGKIGENRLIIGILR